MWLEKKYKLFAPIGNEKEKCANDNEQYHGQVGSFSALHLILIYRHTNENEAKQKDTQRS